MSWENVAEMTDADVRGLYPCSRTLPLLATPPAPTHASRAGRRPVAVAAAIVAEVTPDGDFRP